MSQKKCRICRDIATKAVAYVVTHNGARVVHETCDRHAGPLGRDMVRAGWKREVSA